jgi:hypothetical protein
MGRGMKQLTLAAVGLERYAKTTLSSGGGASPEATRGNNDAQAERVSSRVNC